MTVPGSPTLEGAPYGAQPVVQVNGPQGGPYDLVQPRAVNMIGSGPRTAGIASGDQTNFQHKGLYLFLTVTVNPGGAQTLQLILEGKNGNTGAYFVLANIAATATPGGVWLVYPFAPAGPVGDILLGFNLSLPGQWRVRTVHSGAGSWTYQVDTWLLP